MENRPVPVSLRWVSAFPPNWLGPRIKWYLGASGQEQPRRPVVMRVQERHAETYWTCPPGTEGLAAVADSMDVLLEGIATREVISWSVSYETLIGLDPITDEPLTRILGVDDTPSAVTVFGGAVVGWPPVVVTAHPSGFRAWCAHFVKWVPADGERTLGGPLGVMAPALTASYMQMNDQST